MTKALQATCAASLVTSNGYPVPSATILSQGIGSSVGVLVLDEDRASYVTSNASDIKLAIEKINIALTEISTALTAIAAGMTGPTTAPPPTLPASVAQIAAKVSELTILKETLK